MAEFRMPSLGADMEAGTLVEWLVKPGDKVKRGDIIAVVETQKGAIEIEVFDAGQVEEILVAPETKVPVGTPLARIRSEAEAAAPAQRAHRCRAAAIAAVPEGPRRQRNTGCHRPLRLPSRKAGLAGRTPPRANAGCSTSPRSKAAAPAVRSSSPMSSGALARVLWRQLEQKRAIGLDLDAMRSAIAAAMARSKRRFRTIICSIRPTSQHARNGWREPTRSGHPASAS